MTGPAEPGSRVGFAVLLHQRPDGSRHYDLVVDAPAELLGPPGSEGACPTWSFCRPPGDSPMECRRLFDHPRRFLTYEGRLRPGLGSVYRYDAGACSLSGEPDGTLVITLHGDRIVGSFTITRVGDAPGGSKEGQYLWRPRG